MTNRTQLAKAVIYARESTHKQGDGLESQTAVCREYARFKGYEVERVFSETVSGAIMDRPAMKDLLAYLRANKKEGRIVLIDDISRFARDVTGYWILRGELMQVGGQLESPRTEFKDTADSILNQNLLASVAQHFRQKNAEQTRDRMRGRVLNGHWPFFCPMGFKHVPAENDRGKVLVRDEPVASVIEEALKGFASGRFTQIAEVQRFLLAHPDYPRSGRGLRSTIAKEIILNPLYAGYVEMKAWGIPLRKGQHDGLIDLETYNRNQVRLGQRTYAPGRKDHNAEFPLRGAVACAKCGKPLTSCFSKGGDGAKHPYYMCFAKGCDRYRKSIRRADIETAFGQLLKTLSPSPHFVDLLTDMARDVWGQRSTQVLSMARTIDDRSKQLTKEITALVDRIVKSTSEGAVTAFERRIADLERERLLLDERKRAGGKPVRTFDECFKLALEFFANPSKLWETGDFQSRRLTIRMTFAGHLAYCPESGFRTPELSTPFKLLESRNMRERVDGGEGGIRTHGTLSRTAVFKTAALNHSATSPLCYK
jgi:site-specific DNA recombinase